MAKHWLLTKLIHMRLSTFITYILCLIIVIIFFGYYGKFNYDHLSFEEIDRRLYRATNQDLVPVKARQNCEYMDVIGQEESISNLDVPVEFDTFSPQGLSNGTYMPEHCNPTISVAILVTYRNRQSQLNTYLPYMHDFLRRQNIHYKIYVIEQQDDKPWNKGLLYNVGAKYAIAEKYPCLILHDVDLLPLHSGNLYACLHEPRHLSASIDKFRYVLPYELVGGVLAIRADQYTIVNGFSNEYVFWGGEDDDFYARIKAHKLNILRFPQQLSTYSMLRHRQEPVNPSRFRSLAQGDARAARDGFNSVPRHSATIKQHKLFTLIEVKL